MIFIFSVVQYLCCTMCMDGLISKLALTLTPVSCVVTPVQYHSCGAVLWNTTGLPSQKAGSGEHGCAPAGATLPLPQWKHAQTPLKFPMPEVIHTVRAAVPFPNALTQQYCDTV